MKSVQTPPQITHCGPDEPGPPDTTWENPGESIPGTSQCAIWGGCRGQSRPLLQRISSYVRPYRENRPLLQIISGYMDLPARFCELCARGEYMTRCFLQEGPRICDLMHMARIFVWGRILLPGPRIALASFVASVPHQFLRPILLCGKRRHLACSRSSLVSRRLLELDADPAGVVAAELLEKRDALFERLPDNVGVRTWVIVGEPVSHPA